MTFSKTQEQFNTQLSLFPTPMSNTDRMIIKNGIRFYTNDCKSIPYPVAYRYYKYYKLLYWSGKHVLNTILNGTITRDEITFNVKYYKDCTRGYILKNQDAQFSMSFRAPMDDWNVLPVVIISKCEG